MKKSPLVTRITKTIRTMWAATCATVSASGKQFAAFGLPPGPCRLNGYAGSASVTNRFFSHHFAGVAPFASFGCLGPGVGTATFRTTGASHRPSRTGRPSMNVVMGAEVNKFQIFVSIVGTFLIDMMHHFRTHQKPSKPFLNNQAMFVNIAVIHCVRMVGFENTSISV